MKKKKKKENNFIFIIIFYQKLSFVYLASLLEKLKILYITIFIERGQSWGGKSIYIIRIIIIKRNNSYLTNISNYDNQKHYYY